MVSSDRLAASVAERSGPALAGVAATVLLQTGTDLAVVAGILAVGLLYDVAYLRPRRHTQWMLLEPLDGEPDAGDG